MPGKGKKEAKKIAREAYAAVNKINKEVIKRCKSMGVVVSEPKEKLGEQLREGSSEAAKTLAQMRDNKKLRAIYTLLEDNIEAIMMKGMLFALTDNSTVGAQMCRFFIDMYTPDQAVNRNWEPDDHGKGIGFIQNLLYIKMQADANKMSLDDLQKLIKEKTAINADAVVVEEEVKDGQEGKGSEEGDKVGGKDK